MMGLAERTCLSRPLAVRQCSDLRVFSTVSDSLSTPSRDLCTSLDGFDHLILGPEAASLKAQNCYFRNTDTQCWRTSRKWTSSVAIKEAEAELVPSHKLGSGDQSLKNYPSTMSVAPPGASSPGKRRRVAYRTPALLSTTLSSPCRPPSQLQASSSARARPAQCFDPRVYAPEMSGKLASSSAGLALTRLAACPSHALTTMRTATVSVHAPRIYGSEEVAAASASTLPTTIYSCVPRPRTPCRRPPHHPLAPPLLAPHSPPQAAAPNLCVRADGVEMLPEMWGDAAPDVLIAASWQCATAQSLRPHSYAPCRAQLRLPCKPYPSVHRRHEHSRQPQLGKLAERCAASSTAPLHVVCFLLSIRRPPAHSLRVSGVRLGSGCGVVAPNPLHAFVAALACPAVRHSVGKRRTRAKPAAFLSALPSAAVRHLRTHAPLREPWRACQLARYPFPLQP
ncbi:hypothetical protein DFH06DRAFT_1335615 [Mycena polygramma]|nr:hypothetical protein DFH06DRAFT_1335615 [Mycena polygramma]